VSNGPVRRAQRYPDDARRLGVDEQERAAWRDAADAMFVPFDDSLDVHPQAEGFTGHEVWDFGATSAEQYPPVLHVPYVDLTVSRCSNRPISCLPCTCAETPSPTG
jgi:trehalose/maltose hydrolase-like predicted phosphorylase